jgi:hypothetical protein
VYEYARAAVRVHGSEGVHMYGGQGCVHTPVDTRVGGLEVCKDAHVRRHSGV